MPAVPFGAEVGGPLGIVIFPSIKGRWIYEKTNRLFLNDDVGVGILDAGDSDNFIHDEV